LDKIYVHNDGTLAKEIIVKNQKIKVTVQQLVVEFGNELLKSSQF